MKRYVIVLVVAFALISLLAPVAHASKAITTSAVTGIGSGAAVAGYVMTPSSSSSSSSATSIGPLVPTWVGCGVKPATYTQSAAHLENQFFTTDAVQDTVVTTRTDSAITVQSSATMQNVNILHGLITASQIRAVASSIGTINGAQSSNSSQFMGLQVDGIPIASNVAPNTIIPLAGLGYVALNEQNGPSASSATTNINVNMIDLYVNFPNLAGLALGTRILVADVGSAFVHTSTQVALSATAYGFQTTGAGGTNSFSTGTFSPVNLGCAGGNQHSQVNTASVSTAGTTGQANDSVSGQITPSESIASAQANLSNVNLLQGLIHGANISLQALAKWTRGGSAAVTMTVDDFTINGQPVKHSPPPNTRISLPGIGYLILNEQYQNVSSSGVTAAAIGLDIYITQANVPGLQLGARIIVGCASASISR